MSQQYDGWQGCIHCHEKAYAGKACMPATAQQAEVLAQPLQCHAFKACKQVVYHINPYTPDNMYRARADTDYEG